MTRLRSIFDIHQKTADLIAFGTWFALFAALAAKHSPWRDEYQAWLVATRTTSWTEFFSAVAYERQPPLYYLLLKAVSVLHGTCTVLPYRAVPLVFSWSFTVLCSALLILGLDAPRWLRYSVPFTVLLLLEYGVIARAYSAALFFLLLAAYFRQRDRITASWWCLAVSGAFHLHFTLIGGTFLIFDFFQALSGTSRGANGKAYWKHSAGPALVFAGTLWLLRPPPDTWFPTGIQWHRLGWRPVMETLGVGLTAIDAWGGPFSWNGNAWAELPVWPIVILLLLLYVQGFPLFAFLVASAGPVAITVGSGWDIGYRHTATLFCAALYLALVSRTCLQRRVPFFGLLVLPMVIVAGRWLWTTKPWQDPPAMPFSIGDEAVRQAGDVIEHSVLIGGARPAAVFTLMGRLEEPVRGYQVMLDDYVDYPRFHGKTRYDTLEAWCADNRKRIGEKFGSRRVLVTMPVGTRLPKTCEPGCAVFKSDRRTVSGENFNIYELRDGSVCD